MNARITTGGPVLICLLLAHLIGAGISQAAATGDDADKPQVLPPQCERALALSAAPAYLREQASVYLYGAQGYTLWREGSNPFSCIVNRDHPKTLKPVCFDAEGTATILPKILDVGAQLAAATPAQTINATIAARFESGEYISPRRPGVAYMLSRYNRPLQASTGALGWFPPHVMFYAPDLTNDDIGHDMRFHNPSQPLPMIGYQGPHGFMIMISDDGTEHSRSDLPGCPDWVYEDDPRLVRPASQSHNKHTTTQKEASR